MPDLELSSPYLRELPTRLLAMAGIRANAASRAALTEHDASHFDFSVLVTLETWNGLSQAELGRRTGLNRKDVADTVARLEHRGSVSRESDPKDARRKIVTLSTEGRAWLQDLKKEVDAAQIAITTVLSPEEVSDLVTILQRILTVPENAK